MALTKEDVMPMVLSLLKIQRESLKARKAIFARLEEMDDVIQEQIDVCMGKIQD